MKKVYLAGQFREHDEWKGNFEKVEGFDFYDPEVDSDQSSSDKFFPQDVKAVSEADFLIANPGIVPSEGTWIEVRYFLALNSEVGKKCDKLIVIWNEERVDWSLEFVEKAGHIVSSVDEAIEKLRELGG